jgi:hypothetical protein
MQVKTKVKAGGVFLNHNQTLVRDRAQVTAGTHPQAVRQEDKGENTREGGPDVI